uniref:Lipin 1 n=1 Tax=Brachionus koreanus TaxID=1199090 RepID=A0A291LM74_9BILA|nr:lipin 1 [Brachionus koreanus]
MCFFLNKIILKYLEFKMETLYDLAERVVGYYDEINKANFTDSMDVIVIRRKDGSLHSTPFYVRFGKLGVLKPKDRIVHVEVNNVLIEDIQMMLDESGEAFFINQDSGDSSFSNVALHLCSAGNHIEESTSVPNIHKAESKKMNDYLKAANTLKDFMIESSDDSKEEKETTTNGLLAPKFYIDSSSCVNLLKYNNPDTFDSVDEKNSDPDFEKLRDQVIKIEKSRLSKNINLSSHKLEFLNLKPGLNEIKFILDDSEKEKKTTVANIFLWDSNVKLVVSDIDGTITKSDLRGHIMSMIGKDWYQDGIVKLFNSIVKNEYKIVYLSARPICQCELTRSLIKNLVQSEESMPICPVFVNPVDFLVAFQSELIENNPEEFKINFLNMLKSLFEDGQSPFVAGFGNKLSDLMTYKSLGLDDNSIFLINSSGRIINSIYGELTYRLIHDRIDEFFPKN